MANQNGFNAEDRVASLFQPDTLLPEQYLETYRRKSFMEPETRLMLAVLEDAVACYQKYVQAEDERGMELFRDAEAWVMRRDSEWLFSFDNICESFGINPAYMRDGLVRWKRAALEKQPKTKVHELGRRKAVKEARQRHDAEERLLKAAGD
ncbi:MAG TPA: hypothetical protein VGH16_20980 [Candidatus Binatia bacterium]|jgi:hypothetical protein